MVWCSWKGGAQQVLGRSHCSQQGGLWPLLLAEPPAATWARRHSSPSPAAREGESRLGWEISTAQTCLCQAAGPAKGLLLGSLLGKACSFLISFPLIAPAPLLWLELHLALKVSQVQDPKAGWFYHDNVCFKVWIKSGQGNAAHDAWGKPSPVTCDSSACRNSGESTAWQSETSG